MEASTAAPLSVHDFIDEIILCCGVDGTISYANRAAEAWAGRPPAGAALADLCASAEDAAALLAVAAKAAPRAPMNGFQLSSRGGGPAGAALFRVYREEATVVLIGQIQDTRTGAFFEQMAALTEELTEAQREQQRQNRALQQMVEERDRLLATVRDLTAPAVPVWEGVLLLPLVGHIDHHRAELVREQLLERVSQERARFVIIDISGIVTVDETVTEALLKVTRALGLLGARAVLVGISPSMAMGMVGMGAGLEGLSVCADLEGGIRHVMAQVGSGDLTRVRRLSNDADARDRAGLWNVPGSPPPR